MNINLHIECLVLENIQLGAGQQPLLQSAVETELTGLINDGGLHSGLMGGGARARVAAGTIRLSEESHPARLGRQIAGAVYRGIGK